MVVKKGPEGKDKDRGYSKHRVLRYSPFTLRIGSILGHFGLPYVVLMHTKRKIYYRHFCTPHIFTYSTFTLSCEKILLVYCLDSVSSGTVLHISTPIDIYADCTTVTNSTTTVLCFRQAK